MELLLPYRFDGPPVQMAVWRRPIMLASASDSVAKSKPAPRAQRFRSSLPSLVLAFDNEERASNRSSQLGLLPGELELAFEFARHFHSF